MSQKYRTKRLPRRFRKLLRAVRYRTRVRRRLVRRTMASFAREGSKFGAAKGGIMTPATWYSYMRYLGPNRRLMVRRLMLISTLKASSQIAPVSRKPTTSPYPKSAAVTFVDLTPRLSDYFYFYNPHHLAQDVGTFIRFSLRAKSVLNIFRGRSWHRTSFMHFRRGFWRTRLRVMVPLRYRLHKRVMVHGQLEWHVTQVAPWVRKVRPFFLRGGYGKTLPLLYKKFGSLSFKRYVRLFTHLASRVKIERFLYNTTNQSIYVWFHSFWRGYFKNMRRWRQFENKTVWFLTRRRLSFGSTLRRNLARIFIRTLGLMGTVLDGSASFVHIFCLFLKRFRHHWRLIRFVKDYMIRCNNVLGTILGCKIIIRGKFTGAMRANKYMLVFGDSLKLLLLTRRTSYICSQSHTRWGVFGIQLWSQLTTPTRYISGRTPRKLFLYPRFLNDRFALRRDFRKSGFVPQNLALEDIRKRNYPIMPHFRYHAIA